MTSIEMKEEGAKGIRLSLRILLVEDAKDWQKDLTDYLESTLRRVLHCGEFLISEVVVAEETRHEAQNAFARFAFHGATLDQRFPRQRGGMVQDLNANALVNEFSSLSRTTVIAIYTAYPDVGWAETSGSLRLPYKIKAPETQPDGRRMHVRDYSRYFIARVLLHYIPQVLAATKQSGFAALRDAAHEAHEAYQPAITHSDQQEFGNSPGFGADEDVANFMGLLFKFQERFTEIFTGVSLDIARSGGIDKQPPKRDTCSDLEEWLTETWDEIEASPTFSSVTTPIRTYFALPNGVRVSQHFIPAFSQLRRKRNRSMHGTVIYSASEFQFLRPAVFRMLDLAALLARLPMIHQPRRDRGHYIAFTDLNADRSFRSDMLFEGNIPPAVAPQEPLYTILPGGTELLPLGMGVRVVRDEVSNRAKLTIWNGK